MKIDSTDFQRLLEGWQSYRSPEELETSRNELLRLIEPGLELRALYSIEDYASVPLRGEAHVVRPSAPPTAVARILPGTVDFSWLKSGDHPSDPVRSVIEAWRAENPLSRLSSFASLGHFVDADGTGSEAPTARNIDSEATLLVDRFTTALSVGGTPVPSADPVVTIDVRERLSIGDTVGRAAVAASVLAEHAAAGAASRVVRVLASSDGEFLLAVARLRAIRVLLNRVLQGFESGARVELWGFAGDESRSDSRATHQIRVTTACSAAFLGACDVVVAEPFSPGGLPDIDALRLAANVPRILYHESHLEAVYDALRGSYYLEVLTAKIVNAAWEVFLALEDRGGVLRVAEASSYLEFLSEYRASTSDRTEHERKT